MTKLKMFGAPITRADAKTRIEDYKKNVNGNGANNLTVYVDFDTLDFRGLTDRYPTANGFRVYFGQDSGSNTVVIVATQLEDGCRTECPETDGYIGFNFGTLCPPACNVECDSDSLAAEVYPETYKKP